MLFEHITKKGLELFYRQKAGKNLATIENTAIATHAYAIGNYLVYGDQLYKVIDTIGVGETLTPGVNIASNTVGENLATLQSGIDSLTGSLTDLSNRLGFGYFNRKSTGNTSATLTFTKETQGSTTRDILLAFILQNNYENSIYAISYNYNSSYQSITKLSGRNVAIGINEYDITFSLGNWSTVMLLSIAEWT